MRRLLRRQRPDRLVLTWPAAEGALGYRLLLRDASKKKVVAKLECRRPSYELPLRGLRPDHHYEWGIQVRSDKFEEWRYHLPYLRLFRPTDPHTPTELEWEPTGAEAYRVLIVDRDLSLTVVNDALLGNRYPVDWRRLIVGHEHTYAIQALVPGPRASWETIHPHKPLPAPPPDVRAQLTVPTVPRGPRPLLFLWTCDVEVNLRHMSSPSPARAVDEQVFVRDGDREYGVNFMMDLLEEFNFRGTFFLDILMEHHVGPEQVERTVEAIVSRGHDVQLHLHPSPNLLFAMDPGLARFAPALGHDDRDLFRGALELAVELFVRRVGYQPVAYRSGAYHLCDEFLTVLPEFDIRIDSSLYPFKNCRTSGWMQTRTEPFWVGNVLEVPISWMLKAEGAGEERKFQYEQLAPVQFGTHQDAFASYVPPEVSEAPATLVYLAHSFSTMSTRRTDDRKAIAAWNQGLRTELAPKLFERLRMGEGTEQTIFELPPDTDRIAVMTRLLHGIARRTDVVGSTMRELREGGLDRWRVDRELPVDTVPVWDMDTQQPSTAPLQVYTSDLLAHLHRERSAA